MYFKVFFGLQKLPISRGYFPNPLIWVHRAVQKNYY